MFDFDASKLLIVGVIALIFIPPKDLPRVLRQAGQFVGKMRRMASEFQGQFMDAMREADLADLREEARKLAAAARVDVGLGAVSDLKSHLAGAIEGKPMIAETSSPVGPVGAPDVGVTPSLPPPDAAPGPARAEAVPPRRDHDEEGYQATVNRRVETVEQAPAASSSA